MFSIVMAFTLYLNKVNYVISFDSGGNNFRINDIIKNETYKYK